MVTAADENEYMRGYMMILYWGPGTSNPLSHDSPALNTRSEGARQNLAASLDFGPRKLLLRLRARKVCCGAGVSRHGDEVFRCCN